MTLLVLLGAIAYLVWFLRLKVGWAHPTTAMLVGWAVLLAAHALLPLGIIPAGDTSYAVIALGLSGWAIPAFWVPRPPVVAGRNQTAPIESIQQSALLVGTAVIAAAVIVGMVAFRARITASVGAASFASLDAQEIRAAMTGRARGGGPLSLLMAFAPLLAALGVIGTQRFSRWWFAAVLLALTVTVQSPARIATLTTVVVAIGVWFYLQNPVDRPSPSRRPMLLAAITAAVSLGYFQTVNNVLGKTELLQRLAPDSSLPAAILSPAYYFTGGISALEAALRNDVDPTVGSAGRSIYVFPRFLSAFTPEVQPPETLAEFIRIPFPFNVYTAFGDMYFDFGVAGVLVLSLIAGWMVAKAHYHARRGSLSAIWLSALLLAVAASSAQAFRLFYLDMVAIGLGGVIVLRWIASRPLNPNPRIRRSERSRLG